MVSVEDAIQPFIPMLNMGVSLDDLLTPILDENPELSREAVVDSLQSHIKPTVKHIPSISKAEKPKINGSRYRNLGRNQYQKTMTCLNDIVRIIEEHPNGVSKTTICRRLRRNSSYWRPKITHYLLELVEDGVIQTDGIGRGTLYFPPNAQVQDRERRYHRLIAETLQVNGDMTMTQLFNRLGCNGGRNRHYVREALQDLANEGWVEMGHRNRWAWTL